MAQAKLTAAIIFAVLAVVLILISTAICGFISTRYNQGDTKTRLLAATAISGITIIIAAVAAVLGIFYGRARQAGAKNMKAIGIAFLIVAIIALLMYVTVVGLTMSVRARNEISPVDKNALIAAVILIVLGFLSMVAAAILFFSLTKGKSGKEAFAELKYRRPAKTKGSTTSTTQVTTSSTSTPSSSSGSP